MIAAALALLLVLSLASRKGRSAGPPCKPGDCDICPFPPCTEAEKRKHIHGH